MVLVVTEKDLSESKITRPVTQAPALASHAPLAAPVVPLRLTPRASVVVVSPSSTEMSVRATALAVLLSAEMRRSLPASLVSLIAHWLLSVCTAEAVKPVLPELSLKAWMAAFNWSDELTAVAVVAVPPILKDTVVKLEGLLPDVKSLAI